MANRTISHIVVASLAGVAMATYLLHRWRKAWKRKRMQAADPIIIETTDALDMAMTRIADDISRFKVISLDCEWCSEKDGRRRPVALLQLATASGYSVLIRLCKLKRHSLSQSLKDLLMDKGILKVGVAVLDDANRLLNDHGLITRGCLDLRHLVYRHLPRDLRSKFTGGLSNLAEIYLDESLNKSDNVRCGNWEAEVLSQEQVKYGAQDVLVAMEIFLEIVHRKLSRIPEQPDSSFWNGVGTMCQGLVDIKYKSKASERKTNTNVLTLDRDKLSINKSSNAYKPRQSQMYHNCRLIAPDGQMLCTCHRQKAEWYVKKGIGTEVSQEPYTVQLNFEPSGMPGLDRAYYLQDKANMCVVCGREDSYIRKNIVPHEYRRHFPEKLKKHTSHDVLLLCLPCHQLSSNYDRIIRQQLVEEYNAPITNTTNARYREDPEKVKARSAAKALQRHKKFGQLPEKRVAELEGVLAKFWNMERVDEDVVNDTVTMSVKCENEDFQGSHGEKVIATVMKEENGLQKFERRWRQNFLETMKPEFLPVLWSVHHRHKTTDGDENKMS
ncbi:exonuclease 3'-5' domain-containing protein 2-like [Acanthaster planci]|uniref:Exonuclease 3'-5' domain-containing protein 2-like n=1 Tax=Acanthaster planci TaxID=133434 RepID=A0A8B7YK02_ACAPL|nr:exonuclease 3'-5' domain-containing protein 2-like [Acanthaster planci]XP_022092748.1 exonuclease 3'-5' domain-containing protein 2-like [Acanthaster planci]XP_022092750.1 exonuclease 3'-5' domain-containing protein 2-like [Acanthaster planci]XP_022092751.1 exonuclease 3'-5' domain-containing protein 2-like [Acanthaster planci]